MRRIAIIVLSFTLFFSACNETTPIPSLFHEPTSIPKPTPTQEAAMMPELLFEITNTPDKMKDPYGIALNSEGSIYVTDAGNGRVLVFKGDGTFTSKWDAQGSGEGEFNSLGFGGLAIDANDNVFVVDNGNHRIQKFDKDGNFLLQWGSEGRGDGQFVRAIGITTDKDNNVYVTDDGNPFVQKFDNNGNFLMKWGGAGKGDGEFSHATGIDVDMNGNIFVADYENKRVQKFDPDGRFIVTWNMGDDISIPGIPEAIAVDLAGTVFVSDYSLGRMQVFDNNGNFILALTGISTANSPLKRPTSIAVDNTGRLFIVNQSGDKISVYQLP